MSQARAQFIRTGDTPEAAILALRDFIRARPGGGWKLFGEVQLRSRETEGVEEWIAEGQFTREFDS